MHDDALIAPAIMSSPGMLFVASPNTPLAALCTAGEQEHGDAAFRRQSADSLSQLYPGNDFNLPSDTLCWSHPVGYCVDPLQMAMSLQAMCKSYGVSVLEGCTQHRVMRKQCVMPAG